jgi:septal ring factor EnvC (AmiA/AmiB activator)
MPGPEPKRRRILAAMLAAAMLPSGIAGAQSVDGASRRALEETERQLEQRRAEAEAVSEAREATRADLGKVRRQLVEIAERLQDEESELALIQQRLDRLGEQKEQRLEALRRQRHELEEVLAHLSRLARRSPTAMLASAGTPLDTYRGVRLVAAVGAGLADRGERLKAELGQVAALREAIEVEHGRSRAQIVEMAARRGALAGLVDGKARLEALLADKGQKVDREVVRLAREAGDLRDLVERLSAAEAERRQDEAARAEAERQTALVLLEAAARQRQRLGGLLPPPVPGHKPAGQAETVVVSAVAQPRLPALARFSETRGTLPMPARGRVVVGFGQHDSVGQLSRGLTIETLEQAQVVAPFDGEVVFAGPFRGYGLLVIISLGEGFHVLLSGMSRLYGVIGQQVLASEPVGEMGTGAVAHPMLYVELRRRGEPIDPFPWMAAAKGKTSG